MKISEGEFLEMWASQSTDEIIKLTGMSKKSVENWAYRLRKKGYHVQSHKNGRPKFGGRKSELTDAEFISIWQKASSVEEVKLKTGLKNPYHRRLKIIQRGVVAPDEMKLKKEMKSPC